MPVMNPLTSLRNLTPSTTDWLSPSDGIARATALLQRLNVPVPNELGWVTLPLTAPAPAAEAFHRTRYGADVSSEPMLTPLAVNWRPSTPTLSVATAERTIVPARVDPSLGPVK